MRLIPGLGAAAEHLDPGTRMGEILFGLIMTLTFTLGAGLVLEQEGREGARALLLATIGCNVAWGLIDGVFYVLGRVFERGRRARTAAAVRAASTAEDAERLVAAELDAALEPVSDEPERRALYGSIARRLAAAAPPDATVTRSDLLGGFWAGWLVFACSFPAAIPFFFIDDPRTALRVSNLLLIALLAVVGWRAGREANARRPWATASSFVVAGLLLVCAAIALGG
ncbi:MAG: hypothetical protein U1F08_08125 [Steroidobacteraceae bacterium]